MQQENATVHLKCSLLLWRICCCLVKDNGIYVKKCFFYISPGDTTDLGESLSLGLWKIVCWNFLFSATVIKSEVSLSDIRLCLFSGVPPGERLTAVLFSSERHPFLILSRSSLLRWLHGVAGSGLTGSKFFFWWLWEPLSFRALFDVTRAAKFPTGGGGGGGGMSTWGGRGVALVFSSWTSLDFMVSVDFFVMSMSFLWQYFPIWWYIFARFHFKTVSFGLSKLKVPSDWRTSYSCFIWFFLASSFSCRFRKTMLLVVWTLAWLFLQMKLPPYLYDNMSVMKTPVMLTPGFSSLVFEFWMFDLGCISFGIFLIWIRDAGSPQIMMYRRKQ